MPFTSRPVRLRGGLGLLVTGVLLLVLGIGAEPARADDKPASTEVQVEGGAAFPRGDLPLDYWESDLGFGATDGYELGFRFRYFMVGGLSISPAFHYIDYKDYVDEDTPYGKLSVRAAVIRYSIDFQYVHGRGRGGLHPVLGLGFSMCRNRFGEEWHDLELSSTESINAPGVEFSIGLRLSEFEATVNYIYNRFDTYRFHDTGYNESYNWDTIIVRLGWAFPTD